MLHSILLGHQKFRPQIAFLKIGPGVAQSLYMKGCMQHVALRRIYQKVSHNKNPNTEPSEKSKTSVYRTNLMPQIDFATEIVLGTSKRPTPPNSKQMLTLEQSLAI